MRIVFLLIFITTLLFSCVINPNQLDSGVPIDSAIDTAPMLDTLTVKIVEAKFTNNRLRPGIYVKWVKSDQAMEYNIYYQLFLL